MHHDRLWTADAEGTDMTASDTGSAAWPGRLLEGGHSVSLIVATAIVVADMIGVGVFTSLGFQVKDIPSGFSILLLWIVGGVVALCGVFSYGELGAMFPRSSGEYNFLSRAYHPAFGFLAGWVSATVGFAAPVALAAMAFGEYAKSVFPGAPPMALAHRHGLAGVARCSYRREALLDLPVGLDHPEGGPDRGVPDRGILSSARRSRSRLRRPSADFGQIISAPFAIGLVFVMYSFSGWNAATYIIGEMARRSGACRARCSTGTLIVLVLYVALNAVFLLTAPIDKLAGQLEVASVSGRYIFGDVGGRIVAAMICIGLISSISAMMWIGPRVTMTIGEDIPAFRVFSRRSAQRRAGLCHPVPACRRNADDVDPVLRGGARLHPVRAAVLLVLHRARRHQASHHAARSAAALPRLGIPDDAAGFPARDRLHDVLSLDRAAAAGVLGYVDHDLGPADLRHLPQAGRARRRDRIPRAAHEHAPRDENGGACREPDPCGRERARAPPIPRPSTTPRASSPACSRRTARRCCR